MKNLNHTNGPPQYTGSIMFPHRMEHMNWFHQWWNSAGTWKNFQSPTWGTWWLHWPFTSASKWARTPWVLLHVPSQKGAQPSMVLVTTAVHRWCLVVGPHQEFQHVPSQGGTVWKISKSNPRNWWLLWPFTSASIGPSNLKVLHHVPSQNGTLWKISKSSPKDSHLLPPLTRAQNNPSWRPPTQTTKSRRWPSVLFQRAPSQDGTYEQVPTAVVAHVKKFQSRVCKTHCYYGRLPAPRLGQECQKWSNMFLHRMEHDEIFQCRVSKTHC